MNRQPIPQIELESARNWQADWLQGLSALAASGVLPMDTATRLAEALAMAGRDLAARQLAHTLDPTGSRSRWDTAGELADRLRRFEVTAWPRIRDGHRQPRDRIEQALAAMLRCSSCPRSRRRLYDLLA